MGRRSFGVNFTDKEFWALKMRAKLLGISIAEYIRRVIIDDLESNGYLQLANIRFRELSNEASITDEDREFVKNLLFREMISVSE
ncbi:MAG: hypothetical protein B6U95_00570 [Thermofilum sp. ex4484_82]|nr:MAG: hypothetical protein B6U95_00570 [Thermofilum sp. ex4484_82]OYT39905.1 MAG: hypothetical protein B6U96_00575 [Archaeoglobales archaeon ex4484_92]